MCRYISGFHHPQTGEIKVADLHSHGNTEKLLGLNPEGPFREMHYLPSQQIECRLTPEDWTNYGVSGTFCAQRVRERWPLFCDFEKWAIGEVTKLTGKKPLPLSKQEKRRIQQRAYRARRVQRFWNGWLQQNTSDALGNISYRNGTIYSYDWWPMGKLVGKKYYLYRDEKYSSTTSSHQNLAHGHAIRDHRTVVFVKFPDFDHYSENLQWYRDEIKYNQLKEKRTQTDWKHDMYKSRIMQLKTSRNIYVQLFRVYSNKQN